MVKFLRAKKDKKNHRRASQTGVYGKMEPVQQTTEISDSRNKAQKVKGEVDEVVDIMNQNIKKVVERGENLEDLEAKTDALQQSSKSFKTSAHKVKRKMWWKNMKFTIILGLVIAIIITLIVLYATGTLSGK